MGAYTAILADAGINRLRPDRPTGQPVAVLSMTARRVEHWDEGPRTALNSRGSWRRLDREPTAEELAVARPDGYFWNEAGRLHSNTGAASYAQLYRIVEVDDAG